MSTPRTITVELGERSYPIVIGSGLLGGDFDLGSYLAGGDCLVVTNETVAPLYLDALKANLFGKSIETIALPDGEAFKTLETMAGVLDKLVSSGANRDTTLIALGGGVVGDITGFAAACYMRGVAFIQVPTTLLAQVDSSVGGKTGVNHALGKNLVGAFHQPRIVLIDTATLDTLPDRELSAGLAEIIKAGAIADAGFFAWLEANMPALVARDPAALAQAVQRSCEIKAEVVAEDEREAGRRGRPSGRQLRQGLLPSRSSSSSLRTGRTRARRMGWRSTLVSGLPGLVIWPVVGCRPVSVVMRPAG